MVCRLWLAVNAEMERLERRWGALEAKLARAHRWYTLSLSEQQALPAAKALYEIDSKIAGLVVEREGLLASIMAIGGSGLPDVAAKLAVAVAVIPVEDFPEAHALVSGALGDLKALCG